jgi:hypothetical protein
MSVTECARALSYSVTVCQDSKLQGHRLSGAENHGL